MITNDGQDLTQARRVCATGSIMPNSAANAMITPRIAGVRALQ
jgi:hypothetical protein